MRWLHIRLYAPFAAFGGNIIDVYGYTRDFPSKSMLTGMFANALGWTRTMYEEHQALQHRIVYGAIREHEPGVITDYQTAKLDKGDKAWTTGVVAQRDGGPDSYKGSHQRWRDYHTDLKVSVVVRLEQGQENPTLEELSEALNRPARPIFIGRKSCLPAAPVCGGIFDADSIISALQLVAPKDAKNLRAMWPESEGRHDADVVTNITDERNWISGLHGGTRMVCEGRISAGNVGK